MILVTKLFLKYAKNAEFLRTARGGISHAIDQIDQIDQKPQREVLWSINNQVWSIPEIEIDHNISFHSCGLEAVVNLVNCGRYTPPHERKIGKFVVNCVVNCVILPKMELTTNVESTTYRGRFFHSCPKSRKPFIFNPVLQAKHLSAFGQFLSLETKSAKGGCL